MFFQLALNNFGKFDTFALEPPLPLKTLFELSLTSPDIEMPTDVPAETVIMVTNMKIPVFTLTLATY
jgi:hypothetical protein